MQHILHDLQNFYIIDILAEKKRQFRLTFLPIIYFYD